MQVSMKLRGLRPTAAPAVLLVLATLAAGDHGFANKFLLISSPYNATISYIQIPEHGGANFSGKPVTLISEGLVHPQGIAIDQKRDRLYVADPNLNKLVSYRMFGDGGGLKVGDQETIADKVEARWVAVDGLGNVFFSHEVGDKIMKLTAAQIASRDTTPVEIFSGVPDAVSAPGGLATDNFFVYWTNKAKGTQTGSVIKGEGYPASGVEAKKLALAKTSAKSYGLCLSSQNVFYTDPEKNVYAVNKANPTLSGIVSTKFGAPRGCVWDGAGTVYIADRTRNGIYSFPGDMSLLEEVQVAHVLDHDDAFGLSIYSGAQRLSATTALLLALLAASFCTMFRGS